MLEDLGSLFFIAALAVFVYLVLFSRGKKPRPPDVPKDPSPEEAKRRDAAIEELERRAESARRKRAAMSAPLGDDPEAAARTLSRFMKKK